eukprot:NODE_342_length_9153_cov_0.637376.p5 type:complete len:273 gc:universal NODE_342_length_9153_cov_0.637376:4241-3423(-)
MLVVLTCASAYSNVNRNEMECERKHALYQFADVAVVRVKYGLIKHTCSSTTSAFTLVEHGIQVFPNGFTGEEVDYLKQLTSVSIGQKEKKKLKKEYCEMAEKFFKQKFEWDMICVHFRYRDSQNNNVVPAFHQDVVNSTFTGIPMTMTAKNIKKFKDDLDQEKTFNVWINIGPDEIVDHNLHFIQPDNFKLYKNPSNNILLPEKDKDLYTFDFSPMNTGSAIVFDSSYYFHASIKYDDQYRRHSMEFRLKKRLKKEGKEAKKTIRTFFKFNK